MNKIVTCLLLLVSTQVFAQGSEGSGADDGGHGIICKHYNISIAVSGGSKEPEVYSIETLDLHEARRNYGNYWGRIRPHNVYDLQWGKMRASIHVLQNSHNQMVLLFPRWNLPAHLVDRALKLEPRWSFGELTDTHDFGAIVGKQKRGCKLIQIGSHNRHSRVVKIDKDVAKLMLPIDIAAILLHEALHSYFEVKETNLVVRQAVMYMLAHSDFQIRNAHLFKELLITKQAVDPSRFK